LHYVLVKRVTTRDLLSGESIAKSGRVDSTMSGVLRAVNAYLITSFS